MTVKSEPNYLLSSQKQAEKPNGLLSYIKKDFHFIIVALIAILFVLYSFLGSGTADAVRACNAHWQEQWDSAVSTCQPLAQRNLTPIIYGGDTNGFEPNLLVDT